MENQEEIWKDVKCYEGFYRVSNFGNVKSLSRKTNKGKILKTVRERNLKERLNPRGYCVIQLWQKGNRKTVTVHRLVALAFIPNPKNKPQINHIDGNKLNNHTENLEWNTAKENIRHAFQIGHGGEGIKNSMSKLTEENIKEIRELYSTKKYSQKDIAQMFNCSHVNIHKIVVRKLWNHI